MTPRVKTTMGVLRITLGMLLGAGSLGACAGHPAAATLPPRPEPPKGWFTVETATADLQLVLPPYIGVFHAQEAIYGNMEPDDGGTIPVGLIAAGPQSAWFEPGKPLQQSIEEDLLGGVPVERRSATSSEPVVLPAGAGQKVRMVVDAGGPDAILVIVWAVALPDSAGYLQVSGPLAGADAWEADMELAAQLMQFSRGHALPAGGLRPTPP